MADTNSMVRIGIVSVVDKPKKMCRVFYPDMNNMVSDWMYILQRPEEEIDVQYVDEHTHNAEVVRWLPKVNDRVLVLYPCGWNTNGYVLGAIP